MFPSPCGDYGSYPGGIPTEVNKWQLGFRPLAGIMVLIVLSTPPAFVLSQDQVSVPLRGLWFLSDSQDSDMEDAGKIVSVPLRGLWFLSRSHGSGYNSYKLHGFRPLAGIMVLIWSQFYKNFYSTQGRCFRPLAGIMVLIRTLYKCLYEAVEMAFCGADHIFSSFFVFCRKMIFKKLLRTEF